MIGRTILPPRNPTSGFWAAAARNGHDAEAVWVAASEALGTVFDLQPAEVRSLMDSDLGQLLADDIGFIDGDARDPDAIEDLIRSRLHHAGWHRLYTQAIAAVRTADSK